MSSLAAPDGHDVFVSLLLLLLLLSRETHFLSIYLLRITSSILMNCRSMRILPFLRNLTKEPMEFAVIFATENLARDRTWNLFILSSTPLTTRPRVHFKRLTGIYIIKRNTQTSKYISWKTPKSQNHFRLVKMSL